MRSIRRFSVLLILGFLLQTGLPLSLCAAPFAYITNAADDTVSIIDVATNTVAATVPVGFAPTGLAVTPDGTWVYAANNASDNVSMISTATNIVTGTVSVGNLPQASGRFIGPGPGGATVASKVGVFRPADGMFYLDYNSSGTWEGCGSDRCLSIGTSGDTPLVGKW